MPDVTVTRTTNMRGRDLQNAVSAMISELSGQSPYSSVRMTQRWEGGARIILDAPGHMSGAVDIQDGSPSRVTVQLNLLSGMARMMRDRAIRDINALADSRLGGTPAASAPAAAPAASVPAAEPERPRREFDPDRAAAATTGIFGTLSALARGVTQGLRTGDARSGVLDQYALPDLPAAPWERAETPAAPPIVAPGYGPATPSYSVSAPASVEKPTEAEVSTMMPPAAPASALAPPSPPPPRRAPAPEPFPWGWALAGATALAGVTVVAVLATRGQEG